MWQGYGRLCMAVREHLWGAGSCSSLWHLHGSEVWQYYLMSHHADPNVVLLLQGLVVKPMLSVVTLNVFNVVVSHLLTVKLYNRE